jgi:hypothetical protein
MSIPRITEILQTLAPVSVSPANYTTTANYADIAEIDAEGKTRVVYTILNAHATNGIKWKVLGSVDNVTFVELEAEAVVAGLASSSWVADATETSYRYFKVQVKDEGGAAHGTAQVRGYAKM